MKKQYPPNLQWGVVRLWIILGLLFLSACFLPSLAGIEGMHGGFAIITICGFLFITSLIVIWIFMHRARQLDKMLYNDNHIAWWDIDKTTWERFIVNDFGEDKDRSKGLFIMVSIISIVLGIILSIVFMDILMLFICLGIIAMLIIPAFTFPWFRKRKKMRNPHLVIISENSVYVGGIYFNWDILGARLKDVTVDESMQPLMMRFNMSYPARTGIESYEIRMPVPEAKRAEAFTVQSRLGFQQKPDRKSKIQFNTQNCPNCGRALPGNPAYCSFCGMSVN